MDPKPTAQLRRPSASRLEPSSDINTTQKTKKSDTRLVSDRSGAAPSSPVPNPPGTFSSYLPCVSKALYCRNSLLPSTTRYRHATTASSGSGQPFLPTAAPRTQEATDVKHQSEALVRSSKPLVAKQPPSNPRFATTPHSPHANNYTETRTNAYILIHAPCLEHDPQSCYHIDAHKRAKCKDSVHLRSRCSQPPGKRERGSGRNGASPFSWGRTACAVVHAASSKEGRCEAYKLVEPRGATLANACS